MTFSSSLSLGFSTVSNTISLSVPHIHCCPFPYSVKKLYRPNNDDRQQNSIYHQHDLSELVDDNVAFLPISHIVQLKIFKRTLSEIVRTCNVHLLFSISRLNSTNSRSNNTECTAQLSVLSLIKTLFVHSRQTKKTINLMLGYRQPKRYWVQKRYVQERDFNLVGDIDCIFYFAINRHNPCH